MIDRRNILKGAAAGLLSAPALMRSASAQTKTLYVGLYASAQGKLMQAQVVPQFERDYQCKVVVNEGNTLPNIATLRATKDAPKFSVMCMDDLGVIQAKQEGLIEQLDPAKIPNLAKVMKRFVLFDRYGVGFAMSSAGIFYNPKVSKPIGSYAEIVDKKYRDSIIFCTPKFTESVLSLIAAAAVVTGKPFAQAQYEIDQSAWGFIKDLKPNIMTIYDQGAQVLMVAQDQAKLGVVEYSKEIYPHTAKGLPLDMCFPKEGAFTGISSITLVKGAPDSELGNAFINRVLDAGVQKTIALGTSNGATVSGLEFPPDAARFMAYPESKMDDMKLFTPDAHPAGGADQALRCQDRRFGPHPGHRAGQPRRAARTERMRQEYGFAHDCRLGHADIGADLRERPFPAWGPGSQAKHRHVVSGLCPVPAHDRRTERSVRPSDARHQEGRD